MPKVLFQVRPDAKKFGGGDVAHIQRLMEYSGRFGVKGTLSSALAPDLHDFDLVHAFNLVRVCETFFHVRNGAKSGKPVALSPIYDDISVLTPDLRTGFVKFVLKHLGRNWYENLRIGALAARGRARPDVLAAQIAKGYETMQRETITRSSVVVTWSASEAQILSERFGPFRMAVLYAGVEPEEIEAASEARFREKLGINGEFALCVAQFSDRKNQEAVIRASDGIPVVFVGNAAPMHGAYYRRCRKIAGRNITFVSGLDRKMLFSAYRAAKVHVLPSLWESAGLSNIEAGAAGCNIVVSETPVNREYFQGRARACDPGSVESVRRQLRDAFEASRDDLRASGHILENFTWENAGRNLAKIYDVMLNS